MVAAGLEVVGTPAAAVGAVLRRHVNLTPDDRADTGGCGLLVELHGAKHIAVISLCNSRNTHFFRCRNKIF